MQSKATTVAEYLEQLSPGRRAAIESVRAVIRENLDPLFEEGMQYGVNSSFSGVAATALLAGSSIEIA